MLLNHKKKIKTTSVSLADTVNPEERRAVESRFGISLCKTSFARAAPAIVYTDWILIRRQEYRLFLLQLQRREKSTLCARIK